jgi:RHS repeat-associated protein
MVDKLEKEKLKREPETPPPTQPSGLAYVRQNRLEHYNDIDYEYDIQGNTVIKRHNPAPALSTEAANETATLAFIYDPENRLVQVQKQWANACVTAHYVYDAFDRRIAKTVSEARWKKPDEKDQALKNAEAKTTWFLWDGDNLIQEIKADQTVTYLYEPDSFVPLARIESEEGQADYPPESVHIPPVEAWEMIEDPHKHEHHVRWWQREKAWLAEQRHQSLWQTRQEIASQKEHNDRIHYYHCDHLGTPLELYDENGHAVWSARYKSWGKIYRYDAKEIDQPLRFLGQYEDEETGLYYNRHRYYDADAGRYITQDPIGLAGGLNAYVYGPNPTGWIDPLGLAKKCPPCYKKDYSTNNTKNRSATYKSERDARNVARTKVGKDPVQVEPNKLRSQDGKWQYRGKPEDLAGHSSKDSPHIHIERLNPETGEVLENWHLRW